MSAEFVGRYEGCARGQDDDQHGRGDPAHDAQSTLHRPRHERFLSLADDWLHYLNMRVSRQEDYRFRRIVYPTPRSV